MNASIIVPVHNEEHVIESTATQLLGGLPADTEIVFACNGCTDRSHEILQRAVSHRALILDLRDPGKANAIREAESRVTAFPRFYVDSDVHIRGTDLMRLADELRNRDLDLVSPRIQFNIDGSSWSARAVNQVWLDLPHGADAGFHHVLGVSRRGRERWGEFPDVMGDDAFIEASIPPDRKSIISTVSVITRPPRTLWSFIRVRERWLRGDRQLRSLGVQPPHVPGQRRALVNLAKQRGRSPAVFLYVTARVIAQALSMAPSRTGIRWYRDATSR